MAPVTLQATSREQVWVGGLDHGPHLLDLHFKGKADQRPCSVPQCFSHLHGSHARIVLFWCCFSSGECDPREALLLDVSAAPKTWRDAVRTQHRSAGLHRREGSLEKRARRMLSESRPKLTAFSLTGLLVALAACVVKEHLSSLSYAP